MRPPPGQVLHFSEDPCIGTFVPHVAATARQSEAYVWAVDAEQAPAYWFPRDCPRVLAWPGPATTAADRRLLSDGRVHAVEYGWLPALRSVRLYAYRFDAGPFAPFGAPQPHAMVATTTVTPLGPAEPVGDLLSLHEAVGIELRLVANLWAFMDEVVGSSLEFSGIRLRNATPRR
ncbi:DUF6886 family protein [Amorphoplanes digitatis]|uniref:Uncharacterized protein n=1 Tax=Actinoplanes digitatis TaxID=1868 RepID=A0A7W7I6N3_9ACTN|nr:DUF6886 family protein [Actinoplanes digitatis]MBB4767487.1 hypothetical protein [Actinoplanes digitatis]BFE67212.1 hypothetical protein GCM10020092_005130 [Actinoplanes digitatis]GID97441.1 hypothetical protein Adi01nite_68530 [Actinoplanes digitatis]